ncbi:MAG TPA: HlyD family secretion protein [Pseudolabrys sp.]|nr:HlyD family secretion protein [Pseudolabrys sp.]
MSEKNLKIVPAPDIKAEVSEAKSRPDEHKMGEAPHKPRRKRVSKKQLRTSLLIVLPAVAVILGGVFWLFGGRYISTDNAYIGAQKVLITPDVAGKITHVAITEGQHVNPGDELFTLDSDPYRMALDQANARVDAARSDFDKLKTNLKSLIVLADLAQKNVELKKHDVDRKTSLVNSQAGSRADVDTAQSAMVTAELQARFTAQQRDTTLNQLLGDPDLPLEKFPAYAQAKALREDAQRNLDHTVVRAPMSGTATQVDNIQIGRFVPAGTPILSVVDDQAPWVDANPKETDITYLRIGQKATLDVDSFPDHTFKGTVVAVSPGTGAQFSILPPQNATGNWVKVVQRVPLRIAFDKDEDTHLLRAGMSVNVEIDTGHSRIPFMSTTDKPTKAAANK